MFRNRKAWLTVGALIVLAALIFTDPDGGLSTVMLLQALSVPVLAVCVAHVARKVLFNRLDLSEAVARAMESPEGSGRVVLAVAIVLSALMLVFSGQVRAQDVRTFIPAGAKTYMPVLKSEQLRFWSDHPAPEVLAGLVEHESCITLTHSRCWNPSSRLRSAREEGAGMGQVTRAWRADGTLRFDTLAELRTRYPEDLKGWSWENVYIRPDYQLRAVVLMSRDLYLRIVRLVGGAQPALAFADAAYNGGFNGIQTDRRACAMKTGCDPDLWFGHVEHTCTKSKSAIYGNRSACDINRHHVHDVLTIRAPKYRALMAFAP